MCSCYSHYLLPSGLISKLIVPKRHDSLDASFSIFIFAYRPLALVSNLRLLDVIVKGLNVVELLDCAGNLFTAIVNLALPFNVLKSGINLLIDKKNSPSVPSGLISKSNELIKDVTVVVDPSGFT